MEEQSDAVDSDGLPADQRAVDAAERVVNFLMGEVMRATRGKANPVIARRIIYGRLIQALDDVAALEAP